MAIKKSGKTFVLDTNVILHDATCIHQFKENDIVIPLTVIEELDHFKRGSQVINLNAREFARTLDTLSGSALFDKGISLGKGKGKVSIAISRGINDEIREIFKEDNPDHRILSTAIDIRNKHKNRDSVILVTKDVNLRMKAKALGLPSEDYTTDRISNVEELYSGKEVVDGYDHALIEELYRPPFEFLLRKHSGKVKQKLFRMAVPAAPRLVPYCYEPARSQLVDIGVGSRDRAEERARESDSVRSASAGATRDQTASGSPEQKPSTKVCGPGFATRHDHTLRFESDRQREVGTDDVTRHWCASPVVAIAITPAKPWSSAVAGAGAPPPRRSQSQS